MQQQQLCGLMPGVAMFISSVSPGFNRLDRPSGSRRDDAIAKGTA